jgi:hypothetical protein
MHLQSIKNHPDVNDSENIDVINKEIAKVA